jgi:hypothetical protein
MVGVDVWSEGCQRTYVLMHISSILTLLLRMTMGHLPQSNPLENPQPKSLKPWRDICNSPIPAPNQVRSIQNLS